MGKVYATYYSTRIDVADAETFKLDVRDAAKVSKLFQEIQPDTVIVTAAKRSTKYCEEHPEAAYKVNVDGTRNIVTACQDTGAKLAFISSDLVFDGTKGRYTEEDEVNPLNTYGRQKVMAEKIIKDTLDDWLIIRASYIYGSYAGRDNFVRWVIENLKNGQEVQVSCDEFVTPIYVESFVDILTELLRKDKKGIYNVGEGECLSKYEFMVRIKTIFQLNKGMVKAVPSEALGQSVKRPKNNCLDLTKIRRELDFSRYSLTGGLQKMKESGKW